MDRQFKAAALEQPPAAVSAPQITVLDTGGQYTHLIARRIRELGVYADVQPSNIPASALAASRGVVISGGPASVYEPGSPNIDPGLLRAGFPVLGICYGHQLIAHHLGGAVQKGDRGEYGLAHLTVSCPTDPLWKTVDPSQIWMSHRDSVSAIPPGFRVIGSSETSGVAAMSDPARRLFGLQFHPEVVHTHAGRQILENFVFDICGAHRDWDISQRVPIVEQRIRDVVQDRNVFFFVSGGVDSTVAYVLCLRALGPERVYGIYVDTGLMRKGETEFVESMFIGLGAAHFIVDYAEEEFLPALASLYDPEAKRRAIGEHFVKVQERILATETFLDGHWILGQGTIYPDTIESGGTAKSDLIKTHHNRVAGIRKLIEAGSIIEPLTSFYKDEVREIGGEIGIPKPFLARHPFPGPGLAIRCLCVETAAPVQKTADGYLFPIKSVGVQGDSRSYRNVLAIARKLDIEMVRTLAPALTNRRSDINRVIALCGSRDSLDSFEVFEAALSKDRLDLLREADAIVRGFCLQHDLDTKVWQFPVILIPAGTSEAPESVVLRPIDSVDGMTADVVLIGAELLDQLTGQLLSSGRIAAVFYDMTHKPPATIEWE